MRLGAEEERVEGTNSVQEQRGKKCAGIKLERDKIKKNSNINQLISNLEKGEPYAGKLARTVRREANHCQFVLIYLVYF